MSWLDFGPDPGWVVVGLPLLAACVLAAIPAWRPAAWCNIAASCLTFAAVCWLVWQGSEPGSMLLADPLALHMALLTALIGATTSVASLGHVAGEVAQGRLDASGARIYHVVYQALLGFMLLALLSDDLAVTWIAVEAATIAGALAVGLSVGLSGRAASVAAGWKYLCVCGAGIALAFFGTVVLYVAVQQVPGAGMAAMSWRGLRAAAPQCGGAVLDLAFVFLLIGYGTKAALAPLHGWMADAHCKGPTPVSAVLSGAMMNVALTIILRLHGVMAANPQAIAPGPPIMALGLLSLLLAAFSLWQLRDVKRFFAYVSIGQNGIAAFAFGLGGAGPVFAGVLHLTLHSLIKASIFDCVGHVAQRQGSQQFADIGGLIAGNRVPGLVLAAGIVAIAGLPPFGLFTSEFMIVTRTWAEAPLLAVPLGIGLVVGGWAVLHRLHTLCLGTPSLGTPTLGTPTLGTPGLGTPGLGTPRLAEPGLGTPELAESGRGTPGLAAPGLGSSGPGAGSANVAGARWQGLAWLPAAVQLVLVVVLGLFMPASVVAWFTAIAEANR